MLTAEKAKYVNANKQRDRLKTPFIVHTSLLVCKQLNWSHIALVLSSAEGERDGVGVTGEGSEGGGE